MKALLSVLALAATIASAQKATQAADTLRIELKQHADGVGHELQVTITNLNNDHFYIRDPTEEFSNPQEDTYRFDSEPVAGAARFHGLVRGSITHVSSFSDKATGDWDRLHRWKEVALNAIRVPAHGGAVSFNVTPSDHVEFSAPGTYTMSMGFTLVTLSPDKSKIVRHHVSTNSINMTLATPTSTQHNEQLSRRSLLGETDVTCSQRHGLLVDAWVQQALFSVKDAKTEALGGSFYGKYKDDIDFCFGPNLKDQHQKAISDGLVKLQDLLDPTGKAKFSSFCDISDTTPGCQEDADGITAENWFKATATGTDVTLCGSFFYASSHCAYQYKSATNSLAGILVRALGISKTIPRERLEPLLPDFEQAYNPVANINTQLSADERVKFYPAWECFLARRSKDEIINNDACRADEQVTADRLGTGLLQDEILGDVENILADANRSRRRLAESIEGRRRLVTIPARPIAPHKHSNDAHATADPVFHAVPAMNTNRRDDMITDLWDDAAVKSKVVALFAKKKKKGGGLESLRLDGSDSELNKVIDLKAQNPTCTEIKKVLDEAKSGTIDGIHNAVKDILTEAAATGVFDLSSDGRQIDRRATLIKALVALRERALKLKIAFGYAVGKRCWWSGLNHAKKIMSGLARKVLLLKAPKPFTMEEPYAVALARATVVTLLGALYHDYSVDSDLSGDQLMNHVMHRMKADANYKDQVMHVLARAYETVFQVASAMKLKHTEDRFIELGLHRHFAAPVGKKDYEVEDAKGRELLVELMDNIHAHYLKQTDKNPPAASTIAIPALIETEYQLKYLVKRKKRMEVREMSVAQWDDYVKGIGKLMDSGMYAKLNGVHKLYSGGRRIHFNPRFLPWHRAFLLIYDDELSKAMGKPIRAPFWDWTIDSSNMENSKIFSPAYFGTWGKGDLPETDTVGDDEEFPGSVLIGHDGNIQNKCVDEGHPFSVVRNFDLKNNNRCVARAQRYWPALTKDAATSKDPKAETILDLLSIGFPNEKKNIDYLKHNHDGVAFFSPPRVPVGADFMRVLEHYVHDIVHNGK
jgi:hypothetical protein